MKVNDISELIKKALPNDNLKLCAEVRQPKISNGHMYLNLKDNSGMIGACVWKSNITSQIKELQDGDNIVVKGTLNYYSGRGSLNFIINKLLKKKGDGDLKLQYNKIMKDFEKRGYFLPDKKIKIPNKITNILLLTSKTGAAIEDFYHTLENSNCKIEHIDVIVQGNNCPSNICKILKDPKTLEDKNYDMIIITRGGGSFEDLFGFCQPELIETVYDLNIPVLSAIGHQVDTTLLDYVADYVAATPSLAGQFIVNHNKTYINTLIVKKNIMLNNLFLNIKNKIDILNNQKRKVDNFKYELNDIKIKIKQELYKKINNQNLILTESKKKVDDFKYELNDIKIKMKQELYKKINNQNLIFTDLQTKYKINDGIELFSIKNKDINYKKFVSICENNKKFYIKWGDKILKIRAYELL